VIIWCVFFSHHSHAAKLLTAVKKNHPLKQQIWQIDNKYEINR